MARWKPFLETLFSYLFRGRKLNTNFFSLKLLGHPRDILEKIPGDPARKLVSLGFEGHTHIPNFLAPTPSRGRPPPHPKISGPKSLGLGSYFFPDWIPISNRRPETYSVASQSKGSQPFGFLWHCSEPGNHRNKQNALGVEKLTLRAALGIPDHSRRNSRIATVLASYRIEKSRNPKNAREANNRSFPILPPFLVFLPCLSNFLPICLKIFWIWGFSIL